MGRVFAIEITREESRNLRRKKILDDLGKLPLPHLIDGCRAENKRDFRAALGVRIGDAERSLGRLVAQMNRVKALVGKLLDVVIREIGLKTLAEYVIVGREARKQ